MPYDLKRFLRIAIFLFTFCMILYIVLEVSNPLDLLPLFIYPTIIFIPVALLTVKYKLYIAGEGSKKYSVALGVLGLSIGSIVANGLSQETKLCTIVFGAEFVLLLYVLMSNGYKERDQLKALGFKQITSKEFKAITNRLKFSYIRPWITPATRDHYIGNYKGIVTYIFSFETSRSAYLAVILHSENWQLPKFLVKPKTLYDRAISFFKSESHTPFAPPALIEKYNVISDDPAATSCIFTPKMVEQCTETGSIVFESNNNGIFFYQVDRFRDEPENYLPAIQQAYLFASMTSQSK